MMIEEAYIAAVVLRFENLVELTGSSKGCDQVIALIKKSCCKVVGRKVMRWKRVCVGKVFLFKYWSSEKLEKFTLAVNEWLFRWLWTNETNVDVKCTAVKRGLGVSCVGNPRCAW